MKTQAKELMPFHPNIQSTRREFKLSSHTPAACLVTAEGSASIPFSLLMFFFPSFSLFSVSSMKEESLTQSQNSPWTPEPKFMVFAARIIRFYPSLSPSASTPEWYKPSVSKMWGRNGTSPSALRVSHDALNGQFVEGDELEPNLIQYSNFTFILLSNYQMTGCLLWSQKPHEELPSPLFGRIASLGLDSQHEFSVFAQVMTCLTLRVYF